MAHTPIHTSTLSLKSEQYLSRREVSYSRILYRQEQPGIKTPTFS